MLFYSIKNLKKKQKQNENILVISFDSFVFSFFFLKKPNVSM